MSLSASSAAVTALNWAAAASVRRIDFACVLIEERRANLQPRITQNPHVVTIELPLPGADERRRYISTLVGSREALFGDGLTAADYAQETAGLALNDLAPPLRAALEGQAKLDRIAFSRLKKTLIERQCHGLLEFVEPQFTAERRGRLDAAKRTLRKCEAD
jgi:hypothetical protein